MELQKNHSIAVIKVNENEIMVKEGVFNQSNIFIEDENKSGILNDAVDFWNENNDFSIENIKKRFKNEYKDVIDFLVSNNLLFKTSSKKHLNIGIISEIDKKIIKDVLDKNSPKFRYEFFSMNICKNDAKNNLKNIDMIVLISNRYTPKQFHYFNYWANKNNITNLISFLDNEYSYIFPVNKPSYTVCYNDVEVHLEASVKNLSELIAHKEDILVNGNKIIPKLSNVYIHLSMVINFIEKFNTFGYEKNVLVYIDLKNMNIERTKVFKMPYCSGCNLHEDYTHIFL